MTERLDDAALATARSPLHGRAALAPAAAPGVSVTERRLVGMLNLRGNPRSRRFTQAVRAEAGLALPRPGRVVGAADDALAQARAICWLGPDEWLLLTAPGQAARLREALEAALAGQHMAVTEQGAGHALLRLAGPCAAQALAKGCALDLHPRVFAAGHCAQTRVAKCNALIIVRSPGAAFDLVVRRSFADYLWRWLCDAGAEYGLRTAAADGLED